MPLKSLFQNLYVLPFVTTFRLKKASRNIKQKLQLKEKVRNALDKFFQPKYI